MIETIYLTKRRVGPLLQGANYDWLINVWEETLRYFRDFAPYSCGENISLCSEKILISLQADTIIAELKSQKSLEEKLLENPDYFQKKFDREKVRNEEFALAIKIRTSKSISIEVLLDVLGMFLQELFLAMNLSGGPCIDLTYTNCILPKKWASFGNTFPPKISMFYFESSWLRAKEWNWPQLNLLSFSDTWEWLEGNKIRGLEIAKHNSQIALFSILQLVSNTNLANPSSILLLSQALESLFSTKKENILSVLKERIALLLGTPPENKNWINKFYELRSRIIHGDHPIIRPSSYTDFTYEKEYFEKYLPLYMDYSEMASLVLIATIQDLIINSAKGFNFKQSIERY